MRSVDRLPPLLYGRRVCVCVRVCVYVCVQYPSYSTPGTHEFRTTDPYSTQLTISHPPLVVHTYTRTASAPILPCPAPHLLLPSPRALSLTPQRFRSVINAELAKLHNVLDDEAEVREQEDDEVVETLSAYTKKLQQSLHIINSIET